MSAGWVGAMAARPRLTTPGGEGFSSEALSPPPPLANFAHFLERKTQRPHTPAPKPLPKADLQPVQKMGDPSLVVAVTPVTPRGGQVWSGLPKMTETIAWEGEGTPSQLAAYFQPRTPLPHQQTLTPI